MDFNNLDPEAILSNLKIFDSIVLEDVDNIIIPASKILETVSRLPSQNIEEYMIDLTFKVQEKVESTLIT